MLLADLVTEEKNVAKTGSGDLLWQVQFSIGK